MSKITKVEVHAFQFDAHNLGYRAFKIHRVFIVIPAKAGIHRLSANVNGFPLARE